MSHCQLAIFMNITIIHIPNWHISKLILTEAESLQGAGLGIWSSTSLVAKIFTPGSCEKHLHCQNSVTFLVLDYNIVKKNCLEKIKIFYMIYSLTLRFSWWVVWRAKRNGCSQTGWVHSLSEPLKYTFFHFLSFL